MNDLRVAALYERRGAVALIRLNRPEALNAFNAALRTELLAALQRAANDREIRAVVLAAHGRAFSAGADLKEMSSNRTDATQVRRQLENEYGAAVNIILEMNQPVIAAVEGFAAGIGCAFMLASDLVVMADDAYFTLPFHNIGLVPDGGLIWFLERRIGARRAFEWAVECNRVPAAQCQAWGLANRLVPKGTADEAALSWAERLTQRPGLAIAHTKRLLRQAASASFAQSLSDEIAAQTECIGSEDFREGVAAFFEKRAPNFTGQ